MRSGNPTLSENTFKGFEYEFPAHASVMTLNGTVNKTFLLLFLCLFAASLSWSRDIAYYLATKGFILLLSLAAFLLAIMTVVKKHWSPITAPLYALVEGSLIGAISSLVERAFPGIVMNAVLLTFATLAALLLAYKSRLIRATENFKLGVASATGAVALVYVASMVMGFFGKKMPYLHDATPLGIGISVAIVIIAALNLVLDFDFIEKGVEQQAPKHMEWYGAFGLLVTLIWLYMEILRLLLKLRKR